MNQPNNKEIADQARNDAKTINVAIFFDGAQGEYYMTTDLTFEQQLTKVPITVCDRVIHPEELTDLNDFFNREIKYCGTDVFNQAIFMMGEKDGSFFYEPIHIVTPLRLYKAFNPQSGRDFIYKNNKWV